MICQSDGFISAHSEPGKGSTFKIYLPVVAPPMREFASPRPASKPVHGGSETLLVVEDADALRQSEVEFLSAVGYTVLSAANGPRPSQSASEDDRSGNYRCGDA